VPVSRDGCVRVRAARNEGKAGVTAGCSARLQEPGCVHRIESSGVGIELEHLFLKEMKGLAISRWLCSGEFGVGRVRLQASAKVDSKPSFREASAFPRIGLAKAYQRISFSLTSAAHHPALSLR